MNRFFVIVAIGLFFAGCTSKQDLGSESSGDSGAYVPPPGPVDGGPDVYYATYNAAAAPLNFGGPTATPYRGGYTVISGQGYVAAKDTNGNPATVTLTLKFPSAVGTYTCDAAATTEAQESYDGSPGYLPNNYTTAGSDGTQGTCSIEVTSSNSDAGHVIGTFAADFFAGGKLTTGVFDISLGPTQ